MLPGTDPMPPSTTMMYDLMAGNAPTSGDALITGDSSAPEKAANPPDNMNTIALVRAVSMPASTVLSLYAFRSPEAVIAGVVMPSTVIEPGVTRLTPR